MASKTKIEWSEYVWNPITGCTPISEGCKNCYAANFAKRFWGDRKFSDIQFHPNRLELPLKRKKPTIFFVNSMGDLFHENVALPQILMVIDVMKECQHHKFLILTKRPDEMKGIINWLNLHKRWKRQYTSHIWLGVTAENQKRADERIPILLQIPAAKRFVSVEPMLEQINLEKTICLGCHRGIYEKDCGCPSGTAKQFRYGKTQKEKPYWPIDWLICGAETGPKARYMKPEWAMNLYSQCREAGVPFFFKKASRGDEIDLPREYPNGTKL